MSRPMTAKETVLAMEKWHVAFKEVDGWQTHNRNAKGSFSDVRGFMVHHTGDDAPDGIDLKVVLQGRADLPGPLAQFGLNDHGMVFLIGCGRANHAGGGDPRVLTSITNENYGDYPPAPRYHQGSVGAADGNSHFYGVECFYSGNQPHTKEAYASLVKLLAAVLDHHGWSAKSVLGHKEWSNWKIDPGNVDMKRLRADVAAALKAGPGKPVTQAGRPKSPLPRAWRNTRVRKARAHVEDALSLLDQAVAKGRTGAVKTARDAIRTEYQRLPKQ